MLGTHASACRQGLLHGPKGRVATVGSFIPCHPLGRHSGLLTLTARGGDQRQRAALVAIILHLQRPAQAKGAQDAHQRARRGSSTRTQNSSQEAPETLNYSPNHGKQAHAREEDGAAWVEIGAIGLHSQLGVVHNGAAFGAHADEEHLRARPAVAEGDARGKRPIVLRDEGQLGVEHLCEEREERGALCARARNRKAAHGPANRNRDYFYSTVIPCCLMLQFDN